MKVTQLGRVRPVLGVSSLGGGGGAIDGTDPESGGFPPSGSTPIATGSNTWAWGSNVQLITVNQTTKVLGPFVNFADGSNTTVTVDQVGAAASNTIRIHSTGGGGSLTVKDEGSTLSAAVTSIDFTGAGVTATGATSVTVNIPGGGSSSDPTIPSGGTLYDGTSTSGWTQFGSGGLTTFDADSTVPGALYLAKSSTGGNNDYGIYRSTSSLPRTYTTRVKGALSHTNYHGFGLMLGDSTPNAHITWGVTRDSGNGSGRFLQRNTWASPTSNSGQTFYGTTSGTGTMPAVQCWLRLVVNSSSSVDLQHSHDGFHYYTLANLNPGFTVATWGLFIFGFGVDMSASFDWVHES